MMSGSPDGELLFRNAREFQTQRWFYLFSNKRSRR